MAVQDLETVACAGIPEANSLIITAAGQNTPVGTEGNRSYPMHMPFHDAERKTGADIPRAHRPIFAATGQNIAIRTEGHGPDETGMATQDFEALTCIGI